MIKLKPLTKSAVDQWHLTEQRKAAKYNETRKRRKEKKCEILAEAVEFLEGE